MSRKRCDILVGATGAGKSTFLLKNIVEPLLKEDKRILVVKNDFNMDWKDVDFLSKDKKYEELKTFTGIRKVNFRQGRLEKIAQYYSNGVLILEDCMGYIHTQTDKITDWLLLGRRHFGINLFCVFHGLTEVPPKFFTYADSLILFATNDNINKRSKEIFPERLQVIDKARQRIEQRVRKGDKFAYEIINLDIRL